MIFHIGNDDVDQVNIFLPITRTDMVVRITTEMELIGIKMAATNGESWLVTAKMSPMIL